MQSVLARIKPPERVLEALTQTGGHPLLEQDDFLHFSGPSDRNTLSTQASSTEQRPPSLHPADEVRK